MQPAQSLPLPAEFSDLDDYVDSLLNFTTSSDLFQYLCGGVHILDFFTQDPDIYNTLFPQPWRDWFDEITVQDILDLLMKYDLSELSPMRPGPPVDLVEYVRNIRSHLLRRDYDPASTTTTKGSLQTVTTSLPANVVVGMTQKKRHEVLNFTRFVDLVASENDITHLVDFGSGQNYLGRALASPPYNWNVIAIEEKASNIQGAQHMDQKARVGKNVDFLDTPISTLNIKDRESSKVPTVSPLTQDGLEDPGKPSPVSRQKGSIRYIQRQIETGNLQFLSHYLEGYKLELESDQRDGGADSDFTKRTDQAQGCVARCTTSQLAESALQTSGSVSSTPRRSVIGARQDAPRVMAISLHSCGNLIHHGLRSLIQNKSVTAVALVGCCYNLMTERLGPPSIAVPSLRHPTHRVAREASAYDCLGFPMSGRFCRFNHKHGQGLRFNVTARMMALQAPPNWTPENSNAFFTRHFFRALLQRIFLDRGVVQVIRPENHTVCGTDPVIIGSLRKACYVSFRAYVRGAIVKLASDAVRGPDIEMRMKTLTDEEVDGYEQRYLSRKKDLSIVWSLMAFSAGLIEACIVVDRWLYLKEQPEVGNCWVQSVFEYRQSPRNLVVVGIKR